MSPYSDWTRSNLGRSLFSVEKSALSKFLPQLSGDIAVQYGDDGAQSLLDSSSIEHKILLLARDSMAHSRGPVESPDAGQTCYVDNGASLPFLSSSVDLCLLPHMLEFSDNPHGLLRECKDILVSGGHLVILGFNPYSLWGARKLFSKNEPPWNGANTNVYKVRDWLSLLDFHVSGGMMLYYKPPLMNQSLRQKFAFMEDAGDRWWPMLGGVYLLVARKRDAGMTVIDLGAKVRKRSFLNVAEPVTKNSFKS